MLDEFPWHLQQAAEWSALYDLIASIAVFRQLFGHSQADLLSYWNSIREIHPVAQSYRQSFDAWRDEGDTPRDLHDLSEVLDQLGKFLHEQCGEANAAEPFLREAIEMIRPVSEASDDPSLLTSMNNLASLLDSAGRYSEAGELYREVLAARRDCLGHGARDSLISLNNLGSNRQAAGDLAETESLLRQAVRPGRKKSPSGGFLALDIDRQSCQIARRPRQTCRSSPIDVGGRRWDAGFVRERKSQDPQRAGQRGRTAAPVGTL